MRALLISAAVIGLLACAPAARAMDPASSAWAVHDAGQKAAIKHEIYTRLLEALVLDDGAQTQVAFSAMSAPVNELIDQYITWLAGLPVSKLNRSEQVAYWLNLHNVLTIREVHSLGAKGPIDRYRQFPVSTSGAFTKTAVTVEGRPLSIDAIVQDVLRPNFKDYPFQYGLFLAAKGAPSLRREAYTGAMVQAQLADQARRFINNGGVRAKGNNLELSSFYEWFGPELRGASPAVRQHLIQYAEPKLAAKISAAPETYAYRFDRAIPAFEARNATDFDFAARTSGERFGGGAGSPGGGTLGGGS